MPLESLDPGVVTPEKFPLVTRLHHFVQSGFDLDDVLAGTLHVRALEDVFGNEVQQLIDVEKQYDLAIELCEIFARRVELTPAKFVFTANQGHAEDKRGNVERGLELCLEALAIVEAEDDPRMNGYRAWCYNQLGWTKFKLGEFQEGADWAARAVEANPEMWNAHGTLGSCLYELGDDRAYEAFETAMQNGVDPEEPVRLKDDARYQALCEQYDIPLPTEK